MHLKAFECFVEGSLAMIERYGTGGEMADLKRIARMTESFAEIEAMSLDELIELYNRTTPPESSTILHDLLTFDALAHAPGQKHLGPKEVDELRQLFVEKFRAS